MNPKIVGKTAQAIADMAGITIPAGTKILISPQTTVGKDNPYSREKLCPILAFYVEDNWESACKRCMEILHNEGAGHTMVIHSQDKSVIREFALKKPVSRLLVNVPGALGGVGALTGLQPALTLGCGAVGGSATSDNVGQEEPQESDLRGSAPAPAQESAHVSSAAPYSRNAVAGGMTLSRDEIAAITRAVLERLER